MRRDNRTQSIPIFNLTLTEAERTWGPAHIATPADVVTLVQPYFEAQGHASLLLVILNAEGYCLGLYDTHEDVHGPKRLIPDLMRVALLRVSTHTLILAHRHTDGMLTPQEMDLTLTHEFAILAQIFGFRLRDHLILSPMTDEIFSFRRAGWLGTSL